KEAMITPLVEQDLQRQDKFWQEVAKESVVDVQWCIVRDLEALAWEGLGLEEATSTGKGLQQGQEEGQGTREKMPKDTAGAASEAAATSDAKGFYM
ncbi:hypothetical protein C0993_005130, partial [Termitomyces sp. T159_Od127]